MRSWWLLYCLDAHITDYSSLCGAPGLFCEALTPWVVEFAEPRVRVVGFDGLSVLTRDCAPLVEDNVMGI